MKQTLLLSTILLASVMVLTHSSFAQSTPRHNVRADKVEVWERVDTEEETPWFFRFLGDLHDVVFGDPDLLPFGKSVAFLVGVAEYDNISPQLPSVEKDLIAMRQFLLSSGGFDKVYVAKNKIVTPDLVKDYMSNKFAPGGELALGAEERLLFYYSGHGADLGSKTGFMQFSRARRRDRVTDVLAVNECQNWMAFIKAKHILFIYDCCVSGLAFKSVESLDSDGYVRLAKAFSGKGSRIAVTAGTAKQKTFAIDEGLSVFTAAMLSAAQRSRLYDSPFLTITQLMGETENGVARFASQFGQRKLTPRLWPLTDDEGTFVFVNPTGNKSAASEYLAVMNARPKSETEEVVVRDDWLVVPTVYSHISGAMKAAKSGDTIWVRAGLYRESIDFKSGVILRGEGAEKVKVRASANENALYVANCPSGRIQGITFEHARAANYNDATKRSVVLVENSSVDFFRCTIQNGATIGGMGIRNGGRSSVAKCIFRTNAHGGIVVRGTRTEPNLNDNVCRDNELHGISFLEGAGGVADGNTCAENEETGIAIFDSGTEPTLKNNVCRDNKHYGISFTGGAGGVADGNTCAENGETGIAVFDSGTEPTLKNNVCRNNGNHGISFHRGAGGVADGNTCAENEETGIAIFDSGTDPTVRNNEFSDNNTYGIWVERDATPRLEDNRGSGNASGFRNK